jgi:hypothetical protein
MVPDWCKYCIEKLFLVDSDAISVNDDSLSEGYGYSYAIIYKVIELLSGIFFQVKEWLISLKLPRTHLFDQTLCLKER